MLSWPQAPNWGRRTCIGVHGHRLRRCHRYCLRHPLHLAGVEDPRLEGEGRHGCCNLFIVDTRQGSRSGAGRASSVLLSRAENSLHSSIALGLALLMPIPPIAQLKHNLGLGVHRSSAGW